MIDISKNEAHDRLLQFRKQQDLISQGCQDCINNAPDQFTMPFYIYAHARTIDLDERMSIYTEDFKNTMLNVNYRPKYKSIEDVPSKRLIWMPRLTKPRPDSNSMLFKAYPGTDNVKIIWIIPAVELWGNYSKGKLTEESIIQESIRRFQNEPEKLAQKEEDDLPEERIREIYDDIRKVYGNSRYEMI